MKSPSVFVWRQSILHLYECKSIITNEYNIVKRFALK